MPSFSKKNLRWLVFIGGLLPLALVLVRLQSRGQATWYVVVAAAVYVFVLRRLSDRVAGQGNPRDG